MANLGNAWHIPTNSEPRGRGAMRDPVGAVVAGTAVTIVSGNQFKGPGGNPGNQLQTGSAVFFKKPTDLNWMSVPMRFLRELGNNKYYSASIPAGSFNTGEVGQYYLRIPYSDHDTTFVHASGAGSATTAVEATAQAAPFTFTVEDPAVRGQWGPVFDLPNVAVHANVLPNGHVLMWGRRDNAVPNTNASLDVHEGTPFVWNPQSGQVTNTPKPELADRTKVNLFCSGHAFLEDGRLLVVGGHNRDSDGISQAALYDSATNTWTPTAPMTDPDGAPVRRWYPTATTLPNGDVLIFAGSYIDPARPDPPINESLLQVWSNGTWKTINQADGTPLDFANPPLYPRMHVASDGRVFMSGPVALTQLLKTTTPGGWTVVGRRNLQFCDYCPAVMYDIDKVIFIGGGGPTAKAEIIDLKANPPRWLETGSMKFARRQHNATVLPDGTVLVVGGSRHMGFNNLDPGQPVHTAELWNPKTGNWTELSAELVDRCYHSTAVLLPDGRVLSAAVVNIDRTTRTPTHQKIATAMPSCFRRLTSSRERARALLRLPVP
jgi:galactose oxidase